MARTVPTDFRKMPRGTYRANVRASRRRSSCTGVYNEMKRQRAPIVTHVSDIREMAKRKTKGRKGVRAVVSGADAAIWRRHKGADAVARCRGDTCTCLLYTSPSPRDGLLSRMPSSA